jgi:hypothetical protein
MNPSAVTIGHRAAGKWLLMSIPLRWHNKHTGLHAHIVQLWTTRCIAHSAYATTWGSDAYNINYALV